MSKHSYPPCWPLRCRHPANHRKWEMRSIQVIRQEESMLKGCNKQSVKTVNKHEVKWEEGCNK